MVPFLLGIALVAAFVIRALKIDNPLLDVRLYANRAFAAASVTMTALGAALFGAMVLMPLYFQLVRGEDAVHTGLLLAPQGIGAAMAMALSGRVTERLGGGLTSLIGGAITIVATIPFVLIEADTVLRDLRRDGRARLRHRHVDDAVHDRRLRRPAPGPDQRRHAAAQRPAARRRLDRHRDPGRRPAERHHGLAPSPAGDRRRVRRHLLLGAGHQPRRPPAHDRAGHDRAPREGAAEPLPAELALEAVA